MEIERSIRWYLVGGASLASILLAPGWIHAVPEASSPDVETLASVPLEVTRRGAQVPALVNGKGPFRLMVDCGSESTFLSHDIVGPLDDGIVVIRSAEGVYDKTAWEKATIRVPSIAIGDLTLTDVPAVIVDMGAVFGGKASPDGLLAFDLFSEHLVTLDFPGERFSVLKGALPPADGEEVLDYTEATVKDIPGRYPAIPLQVAGRTLPARFDVVSTGEIMLPSALMETLPLTGEPGRMAIARTPEGVFDILGSVLDGVARIGGHVLEEPKLRFSEIFDDASLGTDLLDQFAVTFDQRNRRVRLSGSVDYGDPLPKRSAHVKRIAGDGEDLRTAFNENAAKVQLMMILSPT